MIEQLPLHIALLTVVALADSNKRPDMSDRNKFQEYLRNLIKVRTQLSKQNTIPAKLALRWLNREIQNCETLLDLGVVAVVRIRKEPNDD